MEHTFQKLPEKGGIGDRFICELVTFDDAFSHPSWVVLAGIEITIEIIFPPQECVSFIFLLFFVLLLINLRHSVLNL